MLFFAKLYITIFSFFDMRHKTYVILSRIFKMMMGYFVILTKLFVIDFLTLLTKRSNWSAVATPLVY